MSRTGKRITASKLVATVVLLLFLFISVAVSPGVERSVQEQE